jgi:phage N-6-adenine-methyltransferase
MVALARRQLAALVGHRIGEMSETKVYHQRGKDDWETPDEVFWPLNEEFGFTLDVCADVHNHKCDSYFTERKNGLKQPWAPNVCWMNPPYSEWQKWVEKAYVESCAGAIVVALLPARTDTRAFHEWIWNECNVEIRFVRGRVKFVGAEHGAPFPSMIVIFRPSSPLSPEPIEDNFFTAPPLITRINGVDWDDVQKDSFALDG